jgi:hypothetical protein
MIGHDKIEGIELGVGNLDQQNAEWADVTPGALEILRRVRNVL